MYEQSDLALIGSRIKAVEHVKYINREEDTGETQMKLDI